MAKIKAIDVIKGISGKFGGNAKEYFATNSSSSNIHLAKFVNPYKGEASARQKEIQEQFKTRAVAASQWLNANKPSDENGDKGTELYQLAMAMKKAQGLSNIRQVVLNHMDEDGNVNLTVSDSAAGGSATGGTSTTKYTLSLSASPAAGGTVTGAGQYNAGASALISAVAKTGYVFSKWSDGNTSASRSVVMTANKTLSAIFVTNAGGEVTPNPDEDGEVNNIH